MNYIIDFLTIILASILFSSQFAKYKLTNWKPISCEYCLAFWITIIYTFSKTNDPFNILYSGGVAQLTKIANVLLIRLYGNLIGK